MTNRLYNNSAFAIMTAEFLRRRTFLSFEDTVEVGKIVETALEAYLGNAFGRVYQKTRSAGDANVDQVLRKSPAGAQFEKPAECHRTHPDESRRVGKFYILPEVLVDIAASRAPGALWRKPPS